MRNPTAPIADAVATSGSASSVAASIARLQSVDPLFLAQAWRLVWAAAYRRSRIILGHYDADLEDVAAEAAFRTLCQADLPLTQESVLGEGVLESIATTTAKRLAYDLIRTRYGRQRGASRRVDPLRRADIITLTDAVTEHSVGALMSPGESAEDALLAQEHERQVQAVWAAAERLPRAQREAVAARRAGRGPLPPAGRQALRAAMLSLQGSVTTADPRTDPRIPCA
ncbi:hypothetical protein [Roseomonas harenae]|uniref:hypothetical protein n=1 Tax=Muricoccus harenae TaxID=2692566 RepID=UPI0013319B76|nr:hypothetical protein [Roseomonas harenae]